MSDVDLLSGGKRTFSKWPAMSALTQADVGDS
jgi:hypothetical protein